MKFVLSSKIFKATVTEANVNYEGSITIDIDLCDKAGLWIGEKVLVVSIRQVRVLRLYYSRKIRFNFNMHEQRRSR